MAGKATIGASSSGALQERYGDWILTIVNQGTADLARLSYAISYTLYDLQTNTPVLSIELTPGGGSLRGMLALPQGLYLRSVGLPPGGKAAPGLASPFATAFPRGCLVELNLQKQQSPHQRGLCCFCRLGNSSAAPGLIASRLAPTFGSSAFDQASSATTAAKALAGSSCLM